MRKSRFHLSILKAQSVLRNCIFTSPQVRRPDLYHWPFLPHLIMFIVHSHILMEDGNDLTTYAGVWGVLRNIFDTDWCRFLVSHGRTLSFTMAGVTEQVVTCFFVSVRSGYIVIISCCHLCSFYMSPNVTFFSHWFIKKYLKQIIAS